MKQAHSPPGPPKPRRQAAAATHDDCPARGRLAPARTCNPEASLEHEVVDLQEATGRGQKLLADSH